MVETPHQITNEARFFLEPIHPRQRQYEALRAYFVEQLPSAEAARQFGYQTGSFRILCWRFRHEMDRNFFRDVPHGPKTQPRKDAVRARIIAMRKRNLSVYDIRDELERVGKDRLSITAIQEVLRQAGFSPLPLPPAQEQPHRPRPLGDPAARPREPSLGDSPVP